MERHGRQRGEVRSRARAAAAEEEKARTQAARATRADPLFTLTPLLLDLINNSRREGGRRREIRLQEGGVGISWF